MHVRYSGIAAVILAFGLIAGALAGTSAVVPANEHFERTWARTDRPVADGDVARTWMWGPEANGAAFYEEYVDAPGGRRLVQYYDKSRMEITDPDGDASSVWYVTNGLLVVEMMDGRMQMGDDVFVDRPAAHLPVAGDGDDPLGPTYATFAGLRDAPPLPDGASITQRVDQAGVVTNDLSLSSYGITTAHRLQAPNIDHQIAAPFWTFMNLHDTVYENGGSVTAPLFLSPFYATGYPLTEPYWAEVKVGGSYRLVLMQCFERRCLTYTPGNPPGFVTEAGNVGLHYYTWRYGHDATPIVTATETPDQTPTVAATTSPIQTETALPTETASQTPTYAPTPTYTPSSTATPTYTPTATATYTPTAAFGPNGRVYVTDLLIDRVQVFDLLGNFLFSFGSTGSGPGQFDHLYGIAVDQRNGWVYVVDKYNDRVQKFDLDGNYLLSWGSSGPGKGEFGGPTGIVVGAGGRVYVADTYHRVQRFEPSGEFIDQWGEAGDADGQFQSPRGLTVNTSGQVFVVDKNNNRVQKFSATGKWLATWAGGFSGPEFIASSSSGTLYLADSFNYRVVVTDDNGNVDAIWTGDRSAPFETLYGIAVANGATVAGTDVVYLAESSASRIVALDGSTGDVLFSFGSYGNSAGRFRTALGVAVYVGDAP